MNARQMRVALAGMVEVLAFAGPVTTALSRYLSERPVPCLASGKRWVHGNDPLLRDAACRYRLSNRGSAARCTPLLRKHGDYARGWESVEKKLFLFFVGLVWRRNGGFSSIGLAPISVIPALSRNPAAPRLRREKVSCDQGLDRTGPRLKAGVTEVPGRGEEAPATRAGDTLKRSD